MCVMFKEIQAKVLLVIRKIAESTIIISIKRKIVDIIFKYKIINTINTIIVRITESQFISLTIQKVRILLIKYKLFGNTLTIQDIMILGVIVLFWYIIFNMIFCLFRSKD